MSTRLHCRACGHRWSELPPDAAGKAVCPRCGARAWVNDTTDFCDCGGDDRPPHNDSGGGIRRVQAPVVASEPAP